MRATIHNSRRGKNGVFSSRHNDRNFNINNANHINSKHSKNNVYWHWLQSTHPQMTFEQAESCFYKQYIQQHLDVQNSKYIANRHMDKVKTMDEYRNSAQTCPEEVIWMIGKKGDTIPAKMLANIVQEQINWEQRTFPGIRVLDVAVHMDEQGAPHIHERRAWVYTDKYGNLAIGQNKSLEQMGIELPNPNKPKSRYNNRKQTFSRLCREHFLYLCKQHGLEINEIPRETSRSGKDLLEYQSLQEREKINFLQYELKQLTRKKNALLYQIDVKTEKLNSLNEECNKVQSQLLSLTDFLHDAEQRKAFNIFYERQHERSRF